MVLRKRLTVLSITAAVTKPALLLIGALVFTLGCSQADTETYSQRVLKKMSVEDPGDPNYPFQLGRLYLREGRLDEARMQFEKALQIDPSFHNAMAGLGFVALEEGQFERAKLIFNQVLNDDPGNQMATKGLQRVSFEILQAS